MKHRAGAIALLASFAILAGCTAPATRVTTIDKLEVSPGQPPQILLMAPDVRMYVMTAGGMLEPQAEWTTTAQQHFTAAAGEFSKGRGMDLLLLPEGHEPDELEIALERLHDAVGGAIMVYHLGMLKLPSKAGTFDWTLGSEVSAVRDRYGADYALFTYYRDYRASGGRVGMMLLFAAAGVAIPMGGSFGFASLVDLRTGDVVWFNRLPTGTGDLRTEPGASVVVEKLLADLPER